MIRAARDTDKARGAVAQTQPNSYYQHPALKPLDWDWKVILYIFLGGLAAGSYVVATLTDLFGKKEDRPVARSGRYIALGAIAVSPLLLITDLGRPERFANMMRIVKTRSPMSVGTWGLAAFGVVVGLGALRQLVEDGIVGPKATLARVLGWFPLPVFGLAGSLFSFFVGSYTGVLLSFTNVPLWARNRLLQGPLFLTSALSSGLAAISLTLAAMGKLPRRANDWLARAESAATLGEIGLVAASLASLGPLSRPLLRRAYGIAFWAGGVFLGLIVPLALQISGDGSQTERRRARNIAASLSILLGQLVLKGVIVLAGKVSVQDSRDYFTFARDRRRSGRPLGE